MITNAIICALILFGIVALVIIADLEDSLENPPDNEAMEPSKNPPA